MTDATNTPPTHTPAHTPALGTSYAAWTWGTFVTLFLVGQIVLGVAAVRLANSDGGERAITGAEDAISRSYDDVTQTRGTQVAAKGDRP